MKNNEFPLPKIAQNQLSNAASLSDLNRLKKQLKIVLNEHKGSVHELSKIDSINNIYKLRRFASFKLEKYHLLFKERGIKIYSKTYKKYTSYKSKMLRIITELNVSEEHLIHVQNLKSKQSIQKYTKNNLENYKKQIKNKMKLLSNKKSSNKNFKEYFDTTEQSIKAIYTPMGNKR